MHPHRISSQIFITIQISSFFHRSKMAYILTQYHTEFITYLMDKVILDENAPYFDVSIAQNSKIKVLTGEIITDYTEFMFIMSKLDKVTSNLIVEPYIQSVVEGCRHGLITGLSVS